MSEVNEKAGLREGEQPPDAMLLALGELASIQFDLIEAVMHAIPEGETRLLGAHALLERAYAMMRWVKEQSTK